MSEVESGGVGRGRGRNEHRLFWGCPWPLLGPQAGPRKSSGWIRAECWLHCETRA